MVDGQLQKSANPFFGGPVCTRYDPESPFADENGIVKLPGCRGALSVVVNDGDSEVDGDETIDVHFEDFYDPRVDGCSFGPSITARANTGPDADPTATQSFRVRAVNEDGETDEGTAQLQEILDATCFNTNLYGVQTQGGVPVVDAFGNLQLQKQASDGTALYLNEDGTLQNGGIGTTPSTSRRQSNPLQRYQRKRADAQAFAGTLFHPWGGCGNASALMEAPLTGLPFTIPGGDDVGDPSRMRPWAVDASAPQVTKVGNLTYIIPDDDGNLVINAGVNPDTAEAEEGTEELGANEAAGTRSAFLCDSRTRDYENDFIEGAFGEDRNGDGLVAAGSQVFRNEMAAWSWNFMMFLTISSCNATSGGDDLEEGDCFRPSTPWALDRCSFSQPQFCRNVKGFLSVGGLRRNDYRAAGNGTFGRRTFLWQSGGEGVVKYKRRNVFGVSADFAEDVTKTNWGIEFTWIGKRPFFDNNAEDSFSSSDTLNLTVSVDRPTFINFLNANRTFFMNTQWFFQYIPNHSGSFLSTGPFNALFTFAVFTGYYQDRLLPQVVTVYDFRSQSGGFLPQVSYRFTEAFSITFGVSFFIGRDERIVMPVNGFAPTSNRAGPNAYTNSTARLLSLIRNRDEAFMRIRWTF